VHEVGKFCSLKDHHPQWETADNGKSLVVTLTSHFANNKVTLFDFELAE
jgi:pterin-4a-carbinolamine dehydratase